MEFVSKQYHSMMSIEDSAFNFEQGPIGFDMFMSNPSDTSMMLEDSCTVDSKSIKEYHTVKIVDSPKDNHSKDCLKFCRKISNIVPKELRLKSGLAKEIIELNSEILKGLLESLGFEDIEAQLLNDLQMDCLLTLWSQFKDIMSYSKNKQICIVKITHWGLIFDKNLSIDSLKTICAKISEENDNLVLKALLNDEIFRGILTKMLFCTNYILTLISIIKDTSTNGKSLRSLETIGNFILLASHPEYFPYYNHRSGKFALECCGKCKVCHSKTIPKDFLKLLEQSRIESELILTQINQIISLYEGRDLALVLLNFFYTQF